MFDDLVKAEWQCPFCGTPQNGTIQFKYGALQVHQYKIGDKISWTDGVAYEERLPNGSGVARGIAVCVNNWGGRWRKEHPAEHYGVMNGRIFDARTPEQVARFGCPAMMNINIEFEGDVIKRVFFPKSSDELFDNL